MKRLLLDHFVPHDVVERKCQTIMTNDYKGLDLKFNVGPAILELYET